MRLLLQFQMAWLLAWAAFFTGLAAGGETPVSSSKLKMDVMALRALHQFQITPEQRSALRQFPPTKSTPAPAAKDKISDNLRKKLSDLRQALIKGAEDRISELENDLEKDQDLTDWELDLEITASVRSQVSNFRKLLSARQVAGFLALYEEDVPDPLSEMLQALELAPTIKAQEWKDYSASAAELVGRQEAGLDPEKINQAPGRVSHWLNQAKGLSEKDLEKKLPELEKEAPQILAGVDPLDVLRNIIDHALAELLANPRLPAVLDALDKQKS